MSCWCERRVEEECAGGLSPEVREHLRECKSCLRLFEELQAAGRSLEDFGDAFRRSTAPWAEAGAERLLRAVAAAAGATATGATGAAMARRPFGFRTAAIAAAAALVLLSLVAGIVALLSGPGAPVEPAVIHVPVITVQVDPAAGPLPRSIPLAPAESEPAVVTL